MFFGKCDAILNFPKSNWFRTGTQYTKNSEIDCSVYVW